MKADIFAYFLENALFFWMIIWMKNVNKFQIAKIQPKDAALRRLPDFCIAYKSVAYKNRLYLHKYESTSYSFGKGVDVTLQNAIFFFLFLYEQ